MLVTILVSHFIDSSCFTNSFLSSTRSLIATLISGSTSLGAVDEMVGTVVVIVVVVIVVVAVAASVVVGNGAAT